MDKDPNPSATGPTKWRAEHCVTHHCGCDCREWEHATRIAELEQDAERYRYLRKHHTREWESDMPHDKGAPSIDLDFSAEGHDLDAAIDRAMGR